MSESRRSAGHAAELQSPLAWALLGLLIERPSYGYELAQRFRQAYGAMLPMGDRKDVYKLLGSLHARELIEEARPVVEEKPAPNRLPRLHYRATEQGARAYAEWLLIQMEESRARERLFARQLAMLEPHAALEVMDRYEEECLAQADESTPAQSEREVVAERLAEQDEQLALEARLSWIRYAREELAELVEQRPQEGERE